MAVSDQSYTFSSSLLSFLHEWRVDFYYMAWRLGFGYSLTRLDREGMALWR